MYSFALLILVPDTRIQERIVAMRMGNSQGKESQCSLASAVLTKMKLFSFYLSAELITQLVYYVD